MVATNLAGRTRRADRIISAMLDRGHGSVAVTYASGRRRVERADTPGDAFATPRLSRDRQSVGWTVSRIDGANYPSPVSLRFVHRGRPRDFSCTSGVPWGWRFATPGRIVVECGFPHGGAPHRRELVDIDTSHVVATFDVVDPDTLARAGPRWARRPLPSDGVTASR